MKGLLLLMLVILMMTAGCTCVTPTANQPPTAYIDSISPTDASLGETVAFNGHGTDRDGDVVAYKWRSDVDGDLGVEASFETSSLSAGTHIIYFKVQDNNGDWSDEVRRRVSVSIADAIADAPVINSFTANPGVIAPGGATTLSWDVSGAKTVSIDQEIGNVALSGSVGVSLSTTTTYTLTAINEAGGTRAASQVIVSEAPSTGLPVINLFSATPGSITPGDSSTLTWSVSNAAAVSINQGVGGVGSTGTTSVSPAATTSYTLTATNAAGTYTNTIQVVVAEEQADVTPPTVPVLESPADGATLSQPTQPWAFHWTDSSDPESGIKQYQLYVKLTGAAPAIDVEVVPSSYSVTSGGYIPAQNCSNWTWKVRAQNNAGLWSDWSPTRTFDVEPPEQADVTPPTVPTLQSPADGATLSQPTQPWAFHWTDSSDPESGIKQYQLYVKHTGAANPIIDVEVVPSGYWQTLGGTIGAESCSNWTWKVRAQNNAGLWSDWSPTRTFDVEPPIETVNLIPVFSECGVVADDGACSASTMFVGDSFENFSFQTFLSFDISGIPAGATVTDVVVDFSDYHMISGDPFGSLGCLRAYPHDYGTLDANDYFAGNPLGAIIRYCSVGAMVAESNSDVANALQAKLGSSRFQMRLQFNEMETDGDGNTDFVMWMPNVHYPKLTVTYSAP